jgi:hypothetical protein
MDQAWSIDLSRSMKSQVSIRTVSGLRSRVPASERASETAGHRHDHSLTGPSVYAPPDRKGNAGREPES